MRIAGQAGFGVMDVVRDVYGSDLVESLNRLRKYPTAKSTPQWRDALSA